MHLHDLTISEMGNYAIKTIDADVQLDDLTLWNNGDGAVTLMEAPLLQQDWTFEAMKGLDFSLSTRDANLSDSGLLKLNRQTRLP